MTYHALAIAVCFAVAGCSSTTTRSYTSGEIKQERVIKTATVISVRVVELPNNPGGAGTATGSLLGQQVGLFTTGSSLTAILIGTAASMVGAAAGAVVDSENKTKPGIEVAYRTDDSEEIKTVIQKQPDFKVAPGVRVKVLEGAFATTIQPI